MPPLLSVQDLATHFPVWSGFLQRHSASIKALNGVSFDVEAGEILGIVGESGCGKSTLGRSIVQLLRPTSGAVWFEGQNLAALSEKAMRPLRRNIQFVFQNPYSSLDPKMKLGECLKEPFWIHQTVRGAALDKAVDDLLDTVGLSQQIRHRYPHELSGGQRQRIGIARALALKPKLIILDEPVSALDVSVQAQILNLLESLQQEFGLTYIFIAHNLSVVEYLSSRIAVMYLGKMVEIAEASRLFHQPRHPYTACLAAAIPVPDPLQRNLGHLVLEGDLPSPQTLPSGCAFHTRCSEATERCKAVEPLLTELSPGHHVACHHPLPVV
jgi:oligopeptide/dipeptide ABC transporter ATP-binding protein